MTHSCHATACLKPVSPEMLFCKKHWFMLPEVLRRQVWKTYVAGQCDDWRLVSRAYCEAAKAAVSFVAKKEGREPDTRLYDMLMATRRTT